MEETEIKDFHQNPPENWTDFTDIYFVDSRLASQLGWTNPQVTKHVHAGLHEEETAAGIEEMAGFYDNVTGNTVEIHIPEEGNEAEVNGREPLMMVRGPAQQLFEPETLALGVSSHFLTEENEGYSHPTVEEYQEGMEQIVEILDDLGEYMGQDIGFADFGARHYHPLKQPELAEAAYRAGAIGHSTEVGCQAANELGADWDPSGTMPHAYVLAHAGDKIADGMSMERARSEATLDAFKDYERIYGDEGPKLLIDTDNSEISETLDVCRYLDGNNEDWNLTVRMDTNGANYAEGVDPETGEKGVSPEAAEAWNRAMIEEGYRDNITFLISSGKGYTDEMEKWSQEAREFYDETGEALFDGVGAGTFDTTDILHTTSDIVMAEGVPLGKKGRLQELQGAVGGDFEVYMEDEMTRYNA